MTAKRGIMKKKDYIDRALAFHKKGFNCAQAVACAFAEEAGYEEKELFRLTEGFGLGMGGTLGTCGAISGAVLLAGLKNSCGDTERPVSKGQTYQLSKAIIGGFQEKNGVTACRDLKGIGAGNVIRSCDGCIEDATALAAEILYGVKE